MVVAVRWKVEYAVLCEPFCLKFRYGDNLAESMMSFVLINSFYAQLKFEKDAKARKC